MTTTDHDDDPALDDPTTQAWQARMMRSAGPVTDPTRMVMFDMNAVEWTEVITGRERPEDIGNPMTKLKALVNPAGDVGCSMQAVNYRPNALVPRHKHNVAQVVLVVEGEVRLGNRRFGPGAGYYTPADFAYSVQAGPEGVTLVEFRPGPLDFSSEYLGETTPHLAG